jgi:hypothetical protein
MQLMAFTIRDFVSTGQSPHPDSLLDQPHSLQYPLGSVHSASSHFVHMLQAHRAYSALCCVPNRWTAGASLAFLAVVIIHRPRDIACATDFVLGGKYAGCAEKKGRCRWSA